MAGRVENCDTGKIDTIINNFGEEKNKQSSEALYRVAGLKLGLIRTRTLQSSEALFRVAGLNVFTPHN